MLKGILGLFKAIKCALDERNRQSKAFRQKQQEIYREGLIEAKLNEQIMQAVDLLYSDDNIDSIQISIAEVGLPFLSSILPSLQCEVLECASPTEFILLRINSFV